MGKKCVIYQSESAFTEIFSFHVNNNNVNFDLQLTQKAHRRVSLWIPQRPITVRWFSKLRTLTWSGKSKSSWQVVFWSNWTVISNHFVLWILFQSGASSDEREVRCKWKMARTVVQLQVSFVRLQSKRGEGYPRSAPRLEKAVPQVWLQKPVEKSGQCSDPQGWRRSSGVWGGTSDL